jgi:hypothetical protein
MPRQCDGNDLGVMTFVEEVDKISTLLGEFLQFIPAE